MTIAFHCSACAVLLNVADSTAGKKCKCPKCGTMNDIPAPAKEVEVVEAVEEVAVVLPAPASRTRQKGKKRGNPARLVVSLIAVGALLLLCASCGVGMLFYFIDFSPEEYRYYPDRADTVTVLRPSDFQNHPVYKDARRGPLLDGGKRQRYQEFESETGILMADIDRLVYVGELTIIYTRNAVQVADLVAHRQTRFPEQKFDRVAVGKFTVYHNGKNIALNSDFAICQIGPQTVFYGPGFLLHGILSRDKKAELAPGMLALLKKPTFRSSVTTVRYGGEGTAKIGSDLCGSYFLGHVGAGLEFVSLVEEVNFRDADVTLRSVITFKEAADIEAARKDVEANLKKLEGDPIAKDITGSATVNGKTLTIELKIPATVISKIKR